MVVLNRRQKLCFAALLVAVNVWAAATSQLPSEGHNAGVVAKTADEETSGFSRAMAPRNFAFPADHGPHPSYQSEWWYYTGNLRTENGRRFGFQLTFFRFALAPRAVERASRWATNQAYMAHFAVTDVAGQRLYSFERFARGALDLAGARAQPFRVWLEDWVAEAQEKTLFPLRLRASEETSSIDLQLLRGKSVVLQGDRGLSQKSAEPGNASYYYSFTRIPVRGTVRLGEEKHSVEGFAWMDREWSTSVLGPDQVGWDWFALQLSDNQELMFYQLRRRDGTPDRFSAGVLVSPDGSARVLQRDDVVIQVLEHWRSPHDGVRYPARWRLEVPAESLDLQITPHVADQELKLSVRYWEGAVRIHGRRGQNEITGHGYVELTGYGSASPPMVSIPKEARAR